MKRRPSPGIYVKLALLPFVCLLCTSTSFAQGDQYGRRFFVQLRAVFGRFRETDLAQAFDKAKAIDCSELVNEKGEWRTVAFFNEKRELGDWYRTSFDEVKTDLAVFAFAGVCRGQHGPVTLTTKFPVRESLDAFYLRNIDLDQVEVNVNAPVRASFDTQTQSYTFDLPYMFLISETNGESLYSLEPPRLLDRHDYSKRVIDHWSCKSVTAENVTYQFLLCRTTTLPARRADRSERAPFGASAYFILSDGREAASDVKLTFDDGKSIDVPTEVKAPPSAEWEVPDADERLVNVVRNEFRIRFNPQTWTGRTSDAQVLSRQQLVGLTSFNPSQGADYCVWLPGEASPFREDAQYVVNAHDQDGPSSTSLDFELITPAGQHIGKLQCSFPRSPNAAGIPFSRWTSIVGPHVTLEVRP